MSSFKLIESLGLKVFPVFNGDGPDKFSVDADEVETLFQNAQKVYGHVNQGKPNYWGPRENGQFNDTHEALLIGIKEIKKEAVKVEFEALVSTNLAGINAMIKRSELIPYIGKRVRVTVEEIESEGI